MSGLGGSRLMIGFAGTEPDDAFASVLRDTGAMGVILFARNAASAKHAAELTERIRGLVDRPLLIAVDQEGGAVTRLVEGVTLFPGNAALGAHGDEAVARLQGKTVGRQLAAAGFDLNLAPVVDRRQSPGNPIVGVRSFGDDPDLVARLASAIVTGHDAGGVASCLKHFPGLGAATVDPHEDLPRLDGGPDSATHADVAAFARVLAVHPDAAVMTTHVVAPGLDADAPATFSARIVTGLLRGELGFDGCVVADDLEMGAVVKHRDVGAAAVACAAAGHDFIPVCHDAARQRRAAETLTRALADGTLDRAEHERAVARIDALRRHRRRTTRKGARMGADTTLAAAIAYRAARVLADPHGLLPLRDRRMLVVTFRPPTDPGHDNPWGTAGASGPAETLDLMCYLEDVASQVAATFEHAADVACELPDLAPDDVLVLATWRPRHHAAQRAVVEEAARRHAGRLVLWCLGGADDDILEGREAAVTGHGWKTPNLLGSAKLIVSR